MQLATRAKQYPLYEQIAGLVDQIVERERSQRWTGLRANVAAANTKNADPDGDQRGKL